MSAQMKYSFLIVYSFSFYFLGVNSACKSDEDTAKDFCSNHVPPKNSVDLKWLHENFEHGWTIQFGNSVMRKRVTKLILGREVNNEEEYSEMCAMEKLDYVEDHFSGMFIGYGGKEAFFNCTGYDCKTISNDRLIEELVRGFVTYFGGKGDHNMISIAWCFENGDVGWYVLSVSETLSEEEKKTITEHLKSIGFNPDLQVPFRTSSC